LRFYPVDEFEEIRNGGDHFVEERNFDIPERRGIDSGYEAFQVPNGSSEGKAGERRKYNALPQR